MSILWWAVYSFLVKNSICGASSALKAQMAYQSDHMSYSHLYDTYTRWESHELPYVSNTVHAIITAVVFITAYFSVQWFGCKACGCVILQLLCHYIEADYYGMCSDTIREIFGEVNDKDVYYVLKPLFMPKNNL